MDPSFDTAAGRAGRLADILKAMAARCATLTRDELMAGFTAAGAVGCRVNSRAEVLDDPQVRHNRLIVEVDQGAIGPVRVARHPIRFSETPAVEQPGPAPSLPPRARR
jgi:crotonobetainyl-CoA:carnitine CoA-transferase CaiB-like acyl-CoA transferase